MKTNLEDKSDTLKSFTCKATKDDLQPIVETVFDELRPRVDASGFRKGKAPNKIVERELGSQLVQNEVVQAAVNELMFKIIEEKNLNVIGSPEINVKKFVPYNELEFEAEIEVMPEIKLPEYKSLDIKYEPKEVTEEEVNEVLENLRSQTAEKEEVDRPAKKDDEVEIDFKGTKDGKEVPGAKATKYPLLLGANRFIPGFEDEVVGLKKGDDKTFTIKFPEDYQEKSLAGEDVEFEIKVQAVKELKKPEIDDDLAKNAGDFESLKDLKSDIKKQLSVEKERETNREFENKLIDSLKNKTKLKLPEKQVEQETERLWEEFNHKMKHQGSDAQEELKKEGKTEDQFKKELNKQAEDRVKTALILTDIADREEIKINEHELNARVNLLKTRYKDDSMRSQLDSPEVQRNIANQLLTEKTIAKLVEYNRDNKKEEK